MVTVTPTTGTLVVASAAAAVLILVLFFIVLFLYLGEKRRSAGDLDRAKSEWRSQQDEWRANQLEIARAEQREQALADARQQLNSWKSQELEAAKIQVAELAHREAQFELEQWKTAHSKGIRQDAIQKSQSVVTGKVTEHFVPYLPEFHFNPKDARFLGTPIDFVVFDGLDDGDVKKVVFIEVKTGTSTLTTRERQVRKAIEARNVEWITLRPPLNQDVSKVIETLDTEYTGESSQNGHVGPASPLTGMF